MIGYEPNIYFKVCWSVVCPLVIAVLILSGIVLSIIDGYPLYDKFVGCSNETLAAQVYRYKNVKILVDIRKINESFVSKDGSTPPSRNMAT